MKSMKKLMQELGFDEKKPSGTAEAFLKHLNHAITQDQRPVVVKPKQDHGLENTKPKQLQFDFSYETNTEIKKSS